MAECTSDTPHMKHSHDGHADDHGQNAKHDSNSETSLEPQCLDNDNKRDDQQFGDLR